MWYGTSIGKLAIGLQLKGFLVAEDLELSGAVPCTTMMLLDNLVSAI